jgi:hypothetical protein
VTDPSGAWEPPHPPPSRHHLVIVALAIALVVALIVGGTGWVAWHNARNDSDEASASSPTSEAGPDSASGPPTTAPSATDPFGALGDLGDLGNLFGGVDPTQLAQCLTGDLGSLLGDRLQLPTDSAAAQYDAVVQWVQQERELKFTTVPKPVYVNAQEMARRVRDQILRDYSVGEANQDQKLLVALGVLQPGANLREEYAQFVGGQVAGYYDTDTHEMVILGDASKPLDANALTTVAHELEHALADQALGIPKAAESGAAQDSDSQLAATALVEGDATLTMTEFQLHTLDLGSLFGQGGGGDITGQADALAKAPHYLASQLLFPYTDGLAFVCNLHNDGWSAVDRAYDEPPTTTAQVMFPERYRSGEGAKTPPAPANPGAGWQKVRTETVGAADLMFLFQAPGNDESKALSDPRGRAAAWAGGSLSLWTRGNDTKVTMSLVARDEAGQPTLCSSVRTWLDRSPHAHAVRCRGDDVAASISG